MFDAGRLLRFHHRAAAEVFDERQTLLFGQRGDFLRGRRLHKTSHEEIAAMHLQNHGGLPADGLGVITQRRFVGGADFAQRRAAGFEDFRDAKPSADLHQFAARDDDLLALAGSEMP